MLKSFFMFKNYDIQVVFFGVFFFCVLLYYYRLACVQVIRYIIKPTIYTISAKSYRKPVCKLKGIDG